MDLNPPEAGSSRNSKPSDPNVIIDKWLKLLDERVEGFRAMAGTCKDLQDFRESHTLEMKAGVMRKVAEDLRKMRDSIEGDNDK